MALAIRLGGEMLHPGDIEGADIATAISERDFKKILTDTKIIPDPGATAKALVGEG